VITGGSWPRHHAAVSVGATCNEPNNATLEQSQAFVHEHSGVRRERGQREQKASPETLWAWRERDECVRQFAITPAKKREQFDREFDQALKHAEARQPE
jgi:hypothetical protein